MSASSKSTSNMNPKAARALERKEELRQDAINRRLFETPRLDHDVLTGRGRGWNNLAGNRRFRSIVDPLNGDYHNSSHKQKKTMLENIFSKITNTEKMKFLLQVTLANNSEPWIQQPKPEALDKIRQRLCDVWNKHHPKARDTMTFTHADEVVTPPRTPNRSPFPPVQVQPDPLIPSNAVGHLRVLESNHHQDHDAAYFPRAEAMMPNINNAMELETRTPQEDMLRGLISSLQSQPDSSDELLSAFSNMIVGNIRQELGQ